MYIQKKIYFCDLVVIFIWIGGHEPSKFIPCFLISGQFIRSSTLFVPKNQNNEKK